jgi:hypothetical protein
MEVKMTKEESEKMFHDALCNEGGCFASAGCELDWDEKEYKKAKASLQSKNKDESICIEDVLLEILRIGGKLKVNDIEGDGENSKEITLKDVHERVQKSPMNCIMALSEDGDGGDCWTAFAVLQTVFFEQEIYG